MDKEVRRVSNGEDMKFGREVGSVNLIQGMVAQKQTDDDLLVDIPNMH